MSSLYQRLRIRPEFTDDELEELSTKLLRKICKEWQISYRSTTRKGTLKQMQALCVPCRAEASEGVCKLICAFKLPA